MSTENYLPILHFKEAERLAETGNLAQACFHTEMIRRLAPALGAGWNAKGNLLYVQGKVEAAVDVCKRALRMDPNN